MFALAALSTFLALAASVPGPAAAPADARATGSRRQVTRLTLRGEIYESSPPFSFFGSALGASHRDIAGAIRQAAADKKVAALILRLKSPLLGWTQRQALRRELLAFRRSGKPSYCFIDSAGGGSYLLASACSEVSLLPAGQIEIPGVSAELVYLKGLLGKLGIHFQELRMGRYKSAAESLTRTDPSDAVREEMHSMLDELYEDFVRAVAENRGLKPVEVRALIDTALYSAEEAKAAGLIDRIEYEDQFLARVLKNADEQLELVDARLGKSLELDLTGFAGFMKLMNEVFGGGAQERASKKPKIAIIFGVGPILPSSGGMGLFGGELMTSDEMVKLFRKVRKDETVKAVVFRINSPGGSALASELIWREVKLTAASKPVVVSMGDAAASGGYYVACPATWIVAENATLTGSIGVIGAVPDMKELYDNVGISFETFSRGKRANLVSTYGKLSDEARKLLLKYMREIYDDFIDHVAEGRKLPRKAVESIAEGRVWTGGQALKHGLVDELGGLDDALRKARELARAPEDVEILTLPEPKDFLDFLRSMSGEEVSVRAALRLLPADLKRLLRSAGWVTLLGKERVLAVMPEIVRIR
jgi:protease-4